MPRRGPVTRADDQQVLVLMDDATTVAPRGIDRRETVSATSDLAAERTRMVAGFAPRHLERHAVAAVRRPVLELLLRMPPGTRSTHSNRSTDQNYLRIAFAFAVYCYNRHGSFDPDRDLGDLEIDEFLRQELSTVTTASKGTYRSTLRRFRRGDAVNVKHRRTPAKRPYSDNEWRRLWQSAHDTGRFQADALTLLALTGGAGLQANEVHRAERHWVTTIGSTTIVRVPDKEGEFREVPVYGKAADAINKAAARDESWLFRPTVTCRANATNGFRALVANEHSHWKSFDAVRARHYWFVRLCSSGVSLPVVCAAGGVKPGAHLITDLLPYMGTPDIRTIDRALRRAMNQNGHDL